MMKYCFPFLLLFLIIGNNTKAQDYYIEGQLSGWITAVEKGSSTAQIGIRYIPSVTLEHYINESNYLDALVSLNSYVSGNVNDLKSFEGGTALRAYRTWMRYAARQWEIRIGLQKLSFGPAMLMRPLMWFDRLDPRDPLKLTTGVYAALFRYYFLNNTNIWIWGLYGNNKTKGWEIFKTKKNSSEFGGRIQYPVGSGELAVSYHYRRFAFPVVMDQFFSAGGDDAPEHRFGIDGKWDYEIGFWFESSFQHLQSDLMPFPYQLLLTYGIDYTFDIGNGLYVTGENFLMKTSKSRFGSGPTIRWSSFLCSYPVSLLDQAQTIVFYDWERGNIYSYFGWQRSYDDWVFHLNLFWNPDRSGLFDGADNGSSVYAGGKGIQILVVYNH